MAGWSMIADGSSLDSAKTPRKLEGNGFWIDLEPLSKGSGVKVEPSNSKPDKLRNCFDQFLRSFLKKICAQDCFWPHPPMLGDGQYVDLFKLFYIVREKGGYESVSKNELWDLVAKESGLGLNVAPAVKLVYIKYLDTFQRWLEKVFEYKDSNGKLSDSSPDLSEYLMELGAEFKDFLSGISDPKKKEEYPHLDMTHELNVSDDGNLCKGDVSGLVESDGDKKPVLDEESMHMDSTEIVGDFMKVGKVCNEDEVGSAVVDLDGDKKSVDIEENQLSDLTKSVVNSSDVEKLCTDDEVKSVVESGGCKKCVNDDDDVIILDSGVVKEEISCRKRKRERETTWKMLRWVSKTAKNPCDPVIGSLPERSKWKSYGNEEFWKQVLLVREGMFLQRNADSSPEQSIWKKNPKMHPCMYDDHIGSSYNLRERLSCGKKLLSGKTSQPRASSESSSSGSRSGSEKGSSPGNEGKENHVGKQSLGTAESSSTDSGVDCHEQKLIPLGLLFQAEVPEWTGVVSESDSKWLGTRIWPLEKTENRFLIERDRIGKGRQDSCGCQLPDSIECVRFHIAEKRLRVRRELGTACHHWKFDKMGEEVALSWAEEEEKKFKAIVRSNPPSLDKCFWDQIFKFFRTKTREDLVSYYFNVFLLRRRAYQNRFTLDNIDSDDDESEFGLVSKGNGHEAIKQSSSILYSPSKQRKNSR